MSLPALSCVSCDRGVPATALTDAMCHCGGGSGSEDLSGSTGLAAGSPRGRHARVAEGRVSTSPPVLCPHYPLGAAGSFSAWHSAGLASARSRPPAHQDVSVPYHILRLCHSLARGPPCRHTVPPSRTAGGKPLSPRPSPLGCSQPEAHGPSSPGIPARVI